MTAEEALAALKTGDPIHVQGNVAGALNGHGLPDCQGLLTNTQIVCPHKPL